MSRNFLRGYHTHGPRARVDHHHLGKEAARGLMLQKPQSGRPSHCQLSWAAPFVSKVPDFYNKDVILNKHGYHPSSQAAQALWSHLIKLDAQIPEAVLTTLTEPQKKFIQGVSRVMQTAMGDLYGKLLGPNYDEIKKWVLNHGTEEQKSLFAACRRGDLSSWPILSMLKNRSSLDRSLPFPINDGLDIKGFDPAPKLGSLFPLDLDSEEMAALVKAFPPKEDDENSHPLFQSWTVVKRHKKVTSIESLRSQKTTSTFYPGPQGTPYASYWYEVTNIADDEGFNPPIKAMAHAIRDAAKIEGLGEEDRGYFIKFADTLEAGQFDVLKKMQMEDRDSPLHIMLMFKAWEELDETNPKVLPKGYVAVKEKDSLSRLEKLLDINDLSSSLAQALSHLNHLCAEVFCQKGLTGDQRPEINLSEILASRQVHMLWLTATGGLFAERPDISAVEYGVNKTRRNAIFGGQTSAINSRPLAEFIKRARSGARVSNKPVLQESVALLYVLMHELAHGIGPQGGTKNAAGSTCSQVFGDVFATFDEGRAEAAVIVMADFLRRNNSISEEIFQILIEMSLAFQVSKSIPLRHFYKSDKFIKTAMGYRHGAPHHVAANFLVGHAIREDALKFHIESPGSYSLTSPQAWVDVCLEFYQDTTGLILEGSPVNFFRYMKVGLNLKFLYEDFIGVIRSLGIDAITTHPLSTQL